MHEDNYLKISPPLQQQCSQNCEVWHSPFELLVCLTCDVMSCRAWRTYCCELVKYCVGTWAAHMNWYIHLGAVPYSVKRKRASKSWSADKIYLNSISFHIKKVGVKFFSKFVPSLITARLAVQGVVTCNRMFMITNTWCKSIAYVEPPTGYWRTSWNNNRQCTIYTQIQDGG
jgi:hypothetical protein